MMNAATRLAPRITTMIRMDHTHVLATFHKYRLDLAPERKEALVETIASALEIHAKLEEEIFYPAMRSAMPDIVEKSVPEHNEMRRLIADLRSADPGSDQYDVALMALMRSVIHHVADEETTLLPEAERTLGDRLEELGWTMTKRRMELVGPRAGEIAMNTMRAYPAVVFSALALIAVGGYLAWRETSGRHARTRASIGALERAIEPAKAWLERPAKYVGDRASRMRKPAKRLLAMVR